MNTKDIEDKKKARLNYDRIHNWIRRNCGKAKHCSNENCLGRGKVFDWALKHGFKYEKNISNFMQLCRSCHCKYDRTQEGNIQISRALKGIKRSDEHKKKISEYQKGKPKLTRRKKVYCYKDGVLVKVFDSVDEVCRELNARNGNVSSACLGKWGVKGVRGFKVSYVQL